MKRTLFALFAAALVLAASSAEARRPAVRWGILGGLNASDYSFRDNRADIENKLGWQLGLMTSLDFARFSIEPQVIYMHQTFRYANVGEKRSATLKSRSIDLPILVAFDVLGPVRLFAGPVVTVMNKCRGGGGVFEESEGFSLSSLRSTCSYTLGVEPRFMKHFRADLRYNGQFKAKNHVRMPDGLEGKMRQHSVSLNVGYFF